MSEYGPLEQVVVIAGNLGAAAVAIRRVWKGDAVFDPPEYAALASRASGLLAIVGLGVLFATTYDSAAPLLADWTLLVVIFALVLMVVDLVARRLWVVSCGGETPITVIGGCWRTKIARKILANDPWARKHGYLGEDDVAPANVEELFCGSGRRKDRIWSRLSQGFTAVVIVGSFTLWQAAATVAVGSVSILVAKALAA